MLAAIDNHFAVMIEFGKLIVEFIYKACIAFLIIAAADYGVTKWKFLKDQKMSFKEIKDEYKNSEGDPHVKAALRQRRMQMLQQGAMDSVPEADFVVRNPTHVACALKYDAETMQSPTLTAKGTELIAKKLLILLFSITFLLLIMHPLPEHCLEWLTLISRYLLNYIKQ